MAFASRTGTRRNIAALANAGWGWMVGPHDMGGPILAGMPWALDNGAWPAFVQGREWDQVAWLKALDRYGRGAKFIVAPDKVGDAAITMEWATKWLPILLARDDLAESHILIAAQDGMAFADMAPLVGGRVGVFIGGTTEWKLNAIIPWGMWARERGIYCHVGRVNTVRRISLCAAGGVRSFDGTSATRYAKTLPRLEQAARQSDLFLDIQAGQQGRLT